MTTRNLHTHFRLFVSVLAIFMLLFIATIPSLAQGETALLPTEGLVFTLNDDQASYCVTGYTGSSTEIVIPSKYLNLPVTSIRSDVFPNPSLSSTGNGATVLPEDSFESDTVVIPTKISIYAKHLTIPDLASVFPKNTEIHGFTGSTAQTYAETYNRTFVAIPGMPEILSANIELGAAITVNYTVDPDTVDIDDLSMRFTANGATTTVSGVASQTDVGCYTFSFKDIGPHMMGDTIRAELLVKGVVFDVLDQYSVRQYCLNMLEKINDKSISGYTDAQYSLLHTLIADLLQYGTDAQTYTNYKTDALVNQGITGMSGYSAPNDMYANISLSASSASDGSRLISAAMELSDVIHLRFSFATSNVSNVTVKIGDETYGSADFIPTGTTNNGLPVYLVYSEPIYATQIEDSYDVTLLVSGTERQTLTYSALNYIYRKQNDTNSSLAALVRSIRSYGRSACAMLEYANRSGAVALYVANENLTYVSSLSNALQQKFETVDVSTNASSVFVKGKYDTVIVAGIDTMSPSATAAMDTYLNNKGRVLMLGGAALEKPYRLNGQYMTLNAYRENVITSLDSSDQQLVFDAKSITGISTPSSGGTLTYTADNYGLSNSTKQLYFSISDLTNYAVLQRNNINVTLTDANIISFYAKAGDGQTNVFTPSIIDADDQEWRLKVSLSDEWTHYTFTPDDFVYRSTSTKPEPDAPLEFKNIKSIKVSFEMAFSKLPAGAHSLYISDIMLSSIQNDSAFNSEQSIFDVTNSAGLGTEKGTNDISLSHSTGDFDLGDGSQQLYFSISDLQSHAVVKASGITVNLENPKELSFYAKAGDARTNVFTIEVIDNITTGTANKWRTKVALSNEWTHYTFETSDFTFRSGDSSATLDFKNIDEVKVAFERSYSGISTGAHSLYISDIILTNGEYVINGVAPLYEQYPITNATDISADANQVFVSDRDYVIPTGTNTLVSRYPGAMGTGFGKDTDIRFIPLLTATNDKGLFSGYVAWIDLYATQTSANGDREGSMVGYFGMATDEFYNANGIAAVVEAALAMSGNVFIVDGGTDEYTYMPENTTIETGIKYVTMDSTKQANVTATVSLYNGSTLLARYTQNNASPSTLSHSIKALQATYARSKGEPTRAVATLSVDGKIVDRIEQDIHYWAPKPEDERSFITTEDGYFKKDGKIINFFGINYFPSYNGAAPEDTKTGITSTYNSFFSKGGYNPEIIDYDLKRLKDIGMNAVAIQANLDDINASNDLLDFLRICEQNGIYVDISLTTHAYLLRNYNASNVQTMIQRLHLHENDNIIAYDIAWEPRIGSYTGDRDTVNDNRYIGRDHWDDEWVAWVKVQYGTVSSALQAWGYPSGLSTSNLVITDDMLNDESGTYRKVVAAYYRFIDDIVSIEMQKNLPHLQSLAPDQLISFRMSMSGSTLRSASLKPSTHCFDFQSLATTMDFMQPEGYELKGTDESSLQIMFANAYARYTKPDAPVVWKEFGKTVWANRVDGNFYPSQAAIANGVDYYRHALEYCYQSYTSGIYCWWSVAGYRANESSDYGVFNPDGSDRGEITALLREYAPKFIGQGARDEDKTAYVQIDRDDCTGGLFGVFDNVKSQLASAYSQGKLVTFVDSSQNPDGSYKYADQLTNNYVADAKTSSGTAPLAYVNGLVKDVEIYKVNGKTYADITVCNTKQSIWCTNTVSIVSTSASSVTLDYTITEQVDYLEDVTVTVELSGNGTLAIRFEVGGVQFGPLYTTTVQ